VLKEISPRIDHVTVIGGRTDYTWSGYLASMEPAAAALHVRLTEGRVDTAAQIEAAIRSLAEKPLGGLVALPNPVATQSVATGNPDFVRYAARSAQALRRGARTTRTSCNLYCRSSHVSPRFAGRPPPLHDLSVLTNIYQFGPANRPAELAPVLSGRSVGALTAIPSAGGVTLQCGMMTGWAWRLGRVTAPRRTGPETSTSAGRRPQADAPVDANAANPSAASSTARRWRGLISSMKVSAEPAVRLSW
jgi:hypothetical protein